MVGNLVARIGKCIYCGATDELTDEHIVPFALGGKEYLGDASCVSCQTITGGIEQHVCRSMLGPARVRMGMPTRRPKERKKPFRVKRTLNGIEETIYVAPEDMPALLMLPKFGQPGIIEDRAPGESLSLIDIQGRSLDPAASDMLRKIGGQIRMLSVEPWKFGRAISKIAHCAGIAWLGQGFDPVLPPIILGESKELSYYFGNSKSEPPPAPIDGKMFSHHMVVGKLEIGGAEYGAVRLRLFQEYATPVYWVIIGRLR